MVKIEKELGIIRSFPSLFSLPFMDGNIKESALTQMGSSLSFRNNEGESGDHSSGLGFSHKAVTLRPPLEHRSPFFSHGMLLFLYGEEGWVFIPAAQRGHMRCSNYPLQTN